MDEMRADASRGIFGGMRKLAETIAKREQDVRPVVLLTLLYLVVSAQAMLPIDDPDLWWRLRTGQWIVEHRSAPLQDYFSSYGMGKPWVEYSWLFDLLMYGVHALFGLSGLVYFVVTMALLITFVAHRLVRRFGLPLPAEIALVAAAIAAMKPLMTPRPWLFTIILFSIELLIIDHVRRAPKSRLVWILPLVFWIWANVHIQFVYGLAVLGLLVAEALFAVGLEPLGASIQAPPLPWRRLMLVLLTCFIATLLTPYHYLIYKQVFGYIGQTRAFQDIEELHPMFFRSPDNWLVLLLTLTAAFILGWRQTWLPFPTLLFLMAAALAFRARRDAWVLALCAIWIIGDSWRFLRQGRLFPFYKRQVIAVMVSVSLALYLLSVARQISEPHLEAVVAQNFPVEAVKFVKANQLPGPLYNDFDWGGFLLWSLPRLPVTIDGRTNVHGDDRLERSLNSWQGNQGWKSDPDLLRARLVIANKRRPLVEFLRADPRYKIVYEDGIAVVFVAVNKAR